MKNRAIAKMVSRQASSMSLMLQRWADLTEEKRSLNKTRAVMNLFQTINKLLGDNLNNSLLYSEDILKKESAIR